MSTEIKDQSASYGPHFLDDLGNGWVNLLAVRPGHEVTATMHSADFLAAVEAECDAIVIDRASLPRVTVRADGSVSVKVFTWSGESDPDDLREVAASYLAAAEYLDAHPPVPPVSDADVETLAGLVDEAGLRVVANASSRLIARRLLATGRVSVTK